MTLYVVAKARNSLSSLPTVLAPQAVALAVHVGVWRCSPAQGQGKASEINL